MTGEDEEAPSCSLLLAPCEDCRDNEIEGKCSGCGKMVCGSCFNGGHEWGVHD